MTTRRWTGVLVLGLALAATPAEPQSVQVGTLRTELPPGATVGGLRGPVSPETGIGALAGSLPASPDTGGIVGVRGSAGTPLAGTRGANAPALGLQGALPPAATTGVLAPPAPPDSFFGSPTPPDVARRNEALAEVHLIDVSLPAADAALDRATDIRQHTFGPTHPAVVEGLENQARLVEQFGRADKAAELLDRAKALRREAERRPAVR